MKKLTVYLSLYLLTGFPALAQQAWTPPLPPGAQAITTNEDLVQTVNTASGEIMLAAPTLHSVEVADALRLAIVERGVAVYILTPAAGIEDPASYVMSLALTGAALSVAPADSPFLVIDRTTLVTGPLLSGIKQLPGQASEQTYYISDANQAAPYVDSFYQSYSAAGAYDYEAFVEGMKDSYIEQLSGEQVPSTQPDAQTNTQTTEEP